MSCASDKTEIPTASGLPRARSVPKISRKVPAVLLSALAALFSLAPLNARAEMIDGIAAVVEDTVIMYSDVIKKMKDLGAEQFDRASVRQVLQMMVEDAVVEKVYRRLGLPPVEKAQVERVSREMAVDTSSARSFIMKSNLMELMVKSRVVITETMIREFYENSGQYRGVESVHLRQILVEKDEDKASRAVEALGSGRPFEDVALEFSDVLLNGSPDIGWVAVDHLAPEVRKAVDAAREGGVAGPVRVDGRILIYQVVERGLKGEKTLDEVRGEIVETLEAKYRDEAFRHWIESVQAQYYVGIYL